MLERRTPEEVFSQPELMAAILKRGVDQAVEQHRRNGLPIVIWHEGKVVSVHPDDLPSLNHKSKTLVDPGT